MEFSLTYVAFLQASEERYLLATYLKQLLVFGITIIIQ